MLDNGWSAGVSRFRSRRSASPTAPTGMGPQHHALARRINETSTWSPVPRQFSHYNVAYAGTLDGVAACSPGATSGSSPLRPPSRTPRRPGIETWQRQRRRRTSISNGGSGQPFVLDGSWRTDFSQVEADEQQINLTRFSRFSRRSASSFSRARPSFQIGLRRERQRESAPRPGAVLQQADRSLSDAGEPIPVIGGVRVTGRAGAAGRRLAEHADRRLRGPSGRQLHGRAVSHDLPALRGGRGFLLRPRSGRRISASIASAASTSASRRGGPWKSKRMRCAARPAHETGDWAGRAGLRLDGTPASRAAGFAPHRRRLPARSGFRPAARHRHRCSGSYARVFRPGDSRGPRSRAQPGCRSEIDDQRR